MASTFFLGPGSLRSDRYLPSLKVPGTGPRRKPAGMQQSALTLAAGARAAPCIVAVAAWQALGLAESWARRECQSQSLNGPEPRPDVRPPPAE